MLARICIPILVILLVALIVPVGHAQDAQNQAGLVIRYGDGRIETACITFNEPSISGLELLQRAGVPIVTQSVGMGAAVCKIANEGCDYPAEDCFCKCKGGNCAYWAYQRLRGDRWAYAQLGPSAVRVVPGDVNGWAWGAGSVESGASPPPIPIDKICAAPKPLPPTTAEPTRPRPAVPTSPRATATPTVPATATIDSPTATAILLPTVTARAEPTQRQTASATTLLATLTALPSTDTPHPTFIPQVTATTTPTDQGNSDGMSYLGFGALALILLGGIGLALRRKR